MLSCIGNKEENSRLRLGLPIFVAVFLMLAVFCGAAFAAKKGSIQKSFASPEEAADALILAVKADDLEQLSAILGPGSKQVLFSGDEVADKSARGNFVRLYDQKNHLVRESDRKAVIEVGNDSWPLPVPIVKGSRGWSFDTKAGREELLNRRIGRNELNTIQVCLAYVDAQREYAIRDRDKDKVLEYARKFVSEPGRRDGLYWEAGEGEEPSPLGPLAATAWAEGYRKKSGDGPTPYHGYYYKILTAQGKNAPGGAYEYVVNGKMIGGFALVAYPAEYESSGIMTFIVNHDGGVYEKNLGKNTAAIARAMKKFDPDKSWRKVEYKNLEPTGKAN